ncbi:MAG: glycosyltransferase family 2 protein [Actinobacteria bacterium]|nr:glycosyltransferase family 2 protein [Actinomycetota bacterium]MBV8959491.1 glycosyltransferase family 2 protein [Actinomycetota bacterium]MBV9253104.1 glycosyltransferase family 2 protein [Actinomycetota bacterium]MBV9665062.1 glycosyltransferase family 2 protein [Actinomycetota bacterium]
MKLSVLVPVYDEAPTVALAIKRLLDVEFPCDVEFVVVDDGSTDGTSAILAQVDDPTVRVLTHPRNQGKGAAIRTAGAAATGDYLVVCDADLEYPPEELPKLLAPVLEGTAEVVYGTRSFGSHTAFSFWYVVGNKVVTLWANLLFNSWISDLETCFKLLPADLYRQLDVRADGFGMEAELTGKLLKRGYRPFEVPVRYTARGREEGKKLTWRDGVAAVFILVAVRVSGRGAARRVPAR